jgi:tRNA dimethylallyltransferase
MMVYRGMDIGTAKPSLKIRAEIRHHLIDIADISQPYNVSTFKSDANKAINAITSESRIPILCGGTGLYARALLYDFSFLPSDKEVAAAVRRDYKNGGEKELKKELAGIDPQTAEVVGRNRQRLLRFVEIIRITGKPIRRLSESENRLRKEGRQFIMSLPVAVLRERIQERTCKMLADGWIEETERLLGNGLLDTPTAGKAMGYSIVADYIEGKIRSESELTEKIVIQTRQYAKRQRTWFRHQHPDAVHLAMGKNWDREQVTSVILSHMD